MPTIEGIPVKSIQITSHICWWCGKKIPRDDDVDIRLLGLAVAPWELGDDLLLKGGSYVYVHSSEYGLASKEMHRLFSDLMFTRHKARVY